MKTLYITDRGKFCGMQDVSTWTARKKYKTVEALRSIGRDGIVADCGISICSVCHKFLGFKDIPAGRISHGYCPACYNTEAAKIKNINNAGIYTAF